MERIGIVGAGVAGLHLALYLQQHGVPVRLYAERTPAEQRVSRLPSTPAHFGNTRARETALGVNHWDAPESLATHVVVAVGGPQPFGFRGELDLPSLYIDHRVYVARLLEDYLERGGTVKFGPLTRAAVPALASEHDLVVIAAGRGGLADLFPVVPERSPLKAPARVLCAAQYHGVAPLDGMNYGVHIAPGLGEVFEGPMNAIDGPRPSFNFEAIPGGPLEPLVRWSYERDPAGFNQEVLRVLREHFPSVHARVTPKEFGVIGPLDIVQGALRPCVRRPYAALPNGRWAVAIGDAHATHDPAAAQGVNAASASAFILGELIREGGIFDERFCRRAEARLWAYVGDVTAWALAFLEAPPPHIRDLMAAAAGNQPLADQFASFWDYPHRAWDAWSTPEITAALVRRFGLDTAPAAVGAAT
jgi:2-polyprenyl-6-methoxyphenol hydroxylase-like FAD-dependent oxidoreductase